MGRGMAEHLYCIGVFCGEDGNLRSVLQRAGEIDEVAVRARYQSFLRQARRNLLRNLRGGGPARNFTGGSIRQSNLNGFSAHAGLSSFLETTSLLARARAGQGETPVIQSAHGC